MDPEDDPNNQGEDEFEEAEDEEHRPVHRVAEEEDEGVEEEEPAAPGQHMDSHRGRGRPAVEEELVVSMRRTVDLYMGKKIEIRLHQKMKMIHIALGSCISV